jgi:hypothetical protein
MQPQLTYLTGKLFYTANKQKNNAMLTENPPTFTSQFDAAGFLEHTGQHSLARNI